MRVEKEYFDVLQNIEGAIVAVYEEQPSLLDIDVLDSFDALIRMYSREKEGRGAPAMKLSGPAQRVFEFAGRVCEWRLGRQPINPGEPMQDDVEFDLLSVSELVLCLQRIRSSVRLWNKQGGRQGYLDYVRQFLGDARRRAGAWMKRILAKLHFLIGSHPPLIGAFLPWGAKPTGVAVVSCDTRREYSVARGEHEYFVTATRCRIISAVFGPVRRRTARG